MMLLRSTDNLRMVNRSLQSQIMETLKDILTSCCGNSQRVIFNSNLINILLWFFREIEDN